MNDDTRREAAREAADMLMADKDAEIKRLSDELAAYLKQDHDESETIANLNAKLASIELADSSEHISEYKARAEKAEAEAQSERSQREHIAECWKKDDEMFRAALPSLRAQLAAAEQRAEKAEAELAEAKPALVELYTTCSLLRVRIAASAHHIQKYSDFTRISEAMARADKVLYPNAERNATKGGGK